MRVVAQHMVAAAETQIAFEHRVFETTTQASCRCREARRVIQQRHLPQLQRWLSQLPAEDAAPTRAQADTDAASTAAGSPVATKAATGVADTAHGDVADEDEGAPPRSAGSGDAAQEAVAASASISTPVVTGAPAEPSEAAAALRTLQARLHDVLVAISSSEELSAALDALDARAAMRASAAAARAARSHRPLPPPDAAVAPAERADMGRDPAAPRLTDPWTITKLPERRAALAASAGPAASPLTLQPSAGGAVSAQPATREAKSGAKERRAHDGKGGKGAALKSSLSPEALQALLQKAPVLPPGARM